MTKKTFVIRDAAIRDRVVAFIAALPLTVVWSVVIKVYKDSKTRSQEEKYHAMIGDIAPHITFMGCKGWDKEDVKRLLLDAFAREMERMGEPLEQGPRLVPSLDGTGVVALGVQSSHFVKDEASKFIEYLFAYGASLGLHWKN